jgi:hypothetical protein
MVARITARLGIVLATTLAMLSSCADYGGPAPSPPPTGAPTASPAPTTSPPTPTPLITILSPPEGERVTAPITASGRANTFEAQLVVDAVNEAGNLLCIRQVTATSGSGTEGSWSATLGIAPESASDSPITLRAYERSALDGEVVNLVERRLVLSAEHPEIFLTSPVCGEVFAPGGAMAVRGRATVFEAALTLELRDQAGAAVFTRNLMTEEGGAESDFGEIVPLPAELAPGLYDLVAFTVSADDGSVENEFPVQVSVQ